MSIRKISIIHHSHADYGYTDHPEVASELHKEYVAKALKLINKKNAHGHFCWTCEVQEPVRAFWESAATSERKNFLKAVHNGSIEICCLPFNLTPFLNEEEWDICFQWLPEEIGEKVKCKCLMQSDVNGIPRAAVRRALDAGIRFLWIGPNMHLADRPFPPYQLFYWKQPDGRKILVYMNAAYNNGNFLFNDNWRLGPIPAVGDMTYRCPTRRDYFRIDKESLLAAHEHCLANLAGIENAPYGANNEQTGANILGTQGHYPYEIFPVSITGQWRYDNDPPFDGLAEFVYEWNRLGLAPELELSTPSRILGELETLYGKSLPEYQGEWTDWWAIGSLSTPLSLAACRDTERTLQKLERIPRSSSKCKKIAKKCLQDLVWYNEHTWGYWGSVAHPGTSETVGHSCKIQNYAFQAQALARWQLSEHLRPLMAKNSPGVTVGNFSDVDTERCIFLETEAFRHELPEALRDEVTGETHHLYVLPGTRNFVPPKPEYCSIENTTQLFADIEPGRRIAFHTGVIPAHTIRHFSFVQGNNPQTHHEEYPVDLTLDDNGWPVSVAFSKRNALFCNGIGSFAGFSTDAFSPRWQYTHVFQLQDPEARLKEAKKLLKPIEATYGIVKSTKDNGTYIYQQNFSHPFLLTGYRRLEIYPRTRQMVMKIHLYRLPASKPQSWYLQFPLNTGNHLPTLSTGGVPFQPGVDQIPGTCQDFYAIDDTVVYRKPGSTLVWSSENSSMVSLGVPQPGARHHGVLNDVNLLNAVLFDDFWDTNFAVGAPGPLDFTFHLAELPEDVPLHEALHTGHELTHTLEFSLQN